MSYTIPIVYTCDGSSNRCHEYIGLSPNGLTSIDKLVDYGWTFHVDDSPTDSPTFHFCPSCRGN